MADPLKHAVRQRASVIAAIALILFVTLLSSFASPAGAAKSLITVFADNQEWSISSTVLTVGEALDRSGVEIGPYDLVEPSRDTFINEAVFRINVYRARPVTIVDGDTQKTLMSPYQSPRLIAKAANIKVYDEDNFKFELIDDIINTGAIGQRLVIDRATPVRVNLYGENITHRTHAKTVDKLLEEMKIKLTNKDKLNLKLEQVIKPNLNIAVIRNGTKVLVADEVVPHKVQNIYDSNMFSGQSHIKTAGKDGTDVVTYEVQLVNNQEVARKVIQRVQKTKSTTEVVVVGTKVVDANSNVSIGRSAAAKRGWINSQWQCLYSLWQKESRWDHRAENPYSGAYGIPQSLPASKMATAGADYLTNPSTQIEWGLNYIASRYGTPCGAWNHSVSHNWY